MAKDLFDRAIGEYLVPISDLREGMVDSMYFLRKDKSFVFAQGYCHPRGSVYCKIIYYPEKGGWVNIHGREYGTTIKKIATGCLELVPHDEQLKRHYEIDPSLRSMGPMPCWAEYHVRLPLTDFLGFFDHRKSLMRAMEFYPQVRDAVAVAGEILEVPPERLGCTGSLSYGRLDEPVDDVDLCIYGTVAQNRRVIAKIRELTNKPEHRVVEFGKFWPIRFYHRKLMICPFFEYLDPAEIPLREMDVEILREGVRAEGVVKDDAHGIYMPLVLALENVKIDGRPHEDLTLIVYDGSVRGEFYRGDLILLNGVRLIRVRERGKIFNALLVTVSPQIAKASPGRRAKGLG